MSGARCFLGLTVILCAFVGGPGESMAVAPADSEAASQCASDRGTGPDVIVGDLPSLRRFGQLGEIIAFAVGTHPCNVGSERVSWMSWTNEHPLILQGVYRLKENRFEQIGMSWVSHEFYAFNESLCGPCTDPTTGGMELGVGCSSSCASAAINGSQPNMSPRSLVEPYEVAFPYPWVGWESSPPESPIARRIQIQSVDIDPAINISARYFVEGHYLAADDAEAGNADNNASYREALLDDGGWSLTFDDDIVTQREQPAVRAWQDVDPTVVETDVRIPGHGLFILAGKAIDLGGGTWGYSYALQNLNSDRAGRSFSVRIPQGANVAGVAFHDVDYHSGEIYDATDWDAEVSQECITWSTESYGHNPLANALRFGTLYSFYFETDVAPAPTRATIELFKPGVYGEIQVDTVGPELPLVDCNGNAVSDECDIDCAAPGCGTPCGTSHDCNDNGTPDECEWDCDGNGIADECDLADCQPGEFWCGDCNSNNVLDECERPCYAIAVPAECSPAGDYDGDGVIDFCDSCPRTTMGYACDVAEPAECCWPSMGEDWCIDLYPYWNCLAEGGIPDLIEAPCRAGCLIGDADADGDFDLADVAFLHTCFSGDGSEPGHAAPAQDCTESFDYDDDVDVDLADFTEFYELLCGP